MNYYLRVVASTVVVTSAAPSPPCKTGLISSMDALCQRRTAHQLRCGDLSAEK
jgi:hypothetical protein